MNNIVYLLLRRLRAPLILLICIYAISILGFVLIPGVDDQGEPWRMDFFHAFYFVSFMGTTIGFGEIPYPFTDAQRMWAIVAIYATVVAWLYGIGVMLGITRDRAFRKLIKDAAFNRGMHRLSEPFYLVCGYGDTGGLLVKALTDAGIRAVVVDIDENRIDVLELEDMVVDVPGICADAADPDALTKAGLCNRHCIGIAILTNDDHVNLTAAIASTLLNPALRVIARAETREAEENIASLGEIRIINPFETFAGHLAMALHAPGMYLLFEWLTGVPHERLHEPVFPPHGTWILCGYGRFGKEVYQRLKAEGIEVRIIEADFESTQPPKDAVAGTGTDAATLRKAGIERAVGIVAGTDNDANNLSIIITAKAINPAVFSVARQNLRFNNQLFDAAGLDLVMKRSSVIAHKIFALITTPLLNRFLDLAIQQSNNWANEIVSRIGGVIEEEAPQMWSMNITEEDTPGVAQLLTAGETIRLADLCHNPRLRKERLPCVPLLLSRGMENILVPDEDFCLNQGDRILFCGQECASREMQWIGDNPDVLRYVRTGEEHPSTILGRLLS